MYLLVVDITRSCTDSHMYIMRQFGAYSYHRYFPVWWWQKDKKRKVDRLECMRKCAATHALSVTIDTDLGSSIYTLQLILLAINDI